MDNREFPVYCTELSSLELPLRSAVAVFTASSLLCLWFKVGRIVGTILPLRNWRQEDQEEFKTSCYMKK